MPGLSLRNLEKEQPKWAFSRLGGMRVDETELCVEKMDRDAGLGPRHQNTLRGAYVLAIRVRPANQVMRPALG
jgi:hypothetical protein